MAKVLSPDVLQVGEDVHVAPADDLLQHGVDDDVAASPDDRFDDFYPNCQQ